MPVGSNGGYIPIRQVAGARSPADRAVPRNRWSSLAQDMGRGPARRPAVGHRGVSKIELDVSCRLTKQPKLPLFDRM